MTFVYGLIAVFWGIVYCVREDWREWRQRRRNHQNDH